MAGERGYPIDDHPLARKLGGKRAFSIASDIRVIYAETESEIIFLDVGTHYPVYCGVQHGQPTSSSFSVNRSKLGNKVFQAWGTDRTKLKHLCM